MGNTMTTDYLTTVERQRDEALDLVERVTRRYHTRVWHGGIFENCVTEVCKEAAQFLVRIRSEMLRENGRELWHADIDTCQERVKEGARA